MAPHKLRTNAMLKISRPFAITILLCAAYSQPAMTAPHKSTTPECPIFTQHDVDHQNSLITRINRKYPIADYIPGDYIRNRYYDLTQYSDPDLKCDITTQTCTNYPSSNAFYYTDEILDIDNPETFSVAADRTVTTGVPDTNGNITGIVSLETVLTDYTTTPTTINQYQEIIAQFSGNATAGNYIVLAGVTTTESNAQPGDTFTADELNACISLIYANLWPVQF